MECFIAGPTASGKTVFGIGLYEYLGGDVKIKNRALSLNRGDVQTIDELYQYMRKECSYPKGTEKEEVRIYIFEKESLLDTITIEFLDYSGEYLEYLPQSIRDYDDLLNKVELYLNDEQLERAKEKLLSFEDLRKLRGSLSVESMVDLMKVYLISKFFMSNKLILLMDGKKLSDYLSGKDVEIIGDIISYKDILYNVIEETKDNDIYPEKEIALVITKADLLDHKFERETGRNRIEDEKKFIKWVDKYLKKSDKKIPAYSELRSLSNKIFATSVKIIHSERRIVTSGFKRVKDWIESVSLLGGRLL